MTLIIPCKACCVQYSAVFVPATPNDGFFSQPLVLHFPAGNMDYPVWCMLCKVLCHFCAGQSKRRQFAAILGSTLSALDIDHPVRGVLCATFRVFHAFSYKCRNFTAAFSSVLCASGEVQHSLIGVYLAALPRALL